MQENGVETDCEIKVGDKVLIIYKGLMNL